MTRRRFWAALLVALGALALAGWVFRADLKRFAYEPAGRDDWQQPERVLAELKLRPGDHVADIGAGGGYFTFRFARAVGPGGKVYAVDVDGDMIGQLSRRAGELGLQNVEPVLAAADDPRLPEQSVDLVFVSNTFHHLHNRPDYFRRLQRHLRPGGRVAIVEFNETGGWLSGHATDAAVIRSELEAAGYELAEQFDFLPRQHFLVFRAAPQRLP